MRDSEVAGDHGDLREGQLDRLAACRHPHARRSPLRLALGNITWIIDSTCGFNRAVQLGAALGLAIVAAIVVAVTGDASDPGARLDGYRAGLVVPVAGVALTPIVSLPGALSSPGVHHDP